MKRIFSLLIFLIISNLLAQEVPLIIEKDPLYVMAGIEVKPEFPGGLTALEKYIVENFRDMGNPKLKGKIFLNFNIEKDGSLSDIKSIRDIGSGTGDEAIRVLKSAPKWKPGMQGGQIVRVMYTLPIMYPPVMPTDSGKLLQIEDKRARAKSNKKN